MTVQPSAAKTASEIEQRRAELIRIAESYFAGLRTKDISQVPWAEDVVLRSPLAPGGLATPLEGRQAVQDWFASLYPVLGDAVVIEHYFNAAMDSIATRADVGITNPPCTLRVVDRFRVGNGKIVEQENHYDPRPAISGV